MEKPIVHIETTINAPLQTVWEQYNNPEAIIEWNQASPDWNCPSSTNDLTIGGRFKNRMEAKDGSFGFDFEGEYLDIIPYQKIVYKIDDGRKVNIKFAAHENHTHMFIEFEAEDTNPIEMQQGGWQAILNSFKSYIENNGKA
ncbi:SRPBCC domain-containing protein [Sphingobacterium bovistauri]|uniref:SRPBCC domain-containing protein n=1 Tax=Sphingobacterium bovistauri TaxID=2781959 RepID=A0ABS7Z4K3_9SPHI|nr:SRPBCC domain-containing protein [Sphingobacterium bovistauri]MCA5005123.1 SRPBCC domain-containing protein [Sphingobacterium bovistauri]